MRITTLEIEVAVMKFFGVRQNTVVPNVTWGMFAGLHECDLLVLSKAGYATEVEIKVDKYDLLKDKEKNHNHNHQAITNLYFAVPEELVELAAENIPERAGIIQVRKKYHKGSKYYYVKPGWYYPTKIVRNAVRRKPAMKWADQHRMNLMRLGTMRILGLKEKLIEGNQNDG